MAQPSADPLSQDSNLSELRRSVPPRVGPPPHTPVRPPPARRPPSARCLRLCTSHALLGPYAVTTIDWIGFPFSRAGPKGNPTAYDERTIENRAPSKAKRHLPIQEHCARACHAYPYARLAHISAAPPLRPPATIPPWLCARSRTRRVIMFLLWPQSRAGHPTRLSLAMGDVIFSLPTPRLPRRCRPPAWLWRRRTPPVPGVPSVPHTPSPNSRL